MTWLNNLVRDTRGAAIIELALIAPVFAGLVVGVTQIANGYSMKLQLEQAAQRTIEKAQQTKVDDTMIATLQGEGADAAGVPTGDVTVDFWLECNGVRQTNYDTVCTSGQSYVRYLTVDIKKTYTPMFSTRLAGADANGNYILHGKAGIRTQ